MRKSFLSVLLSAALFQILAAGDLQAATYYVKKSGSDSNPGTGAQPFLTIQKALDSATNPGDTVYVYAGTYTERSAFDFTGTRFALMRAKYSGTSANPVTIMAAEPGVVLDGQNVANSCLFAHTISNFTVKGFECKNVNVSAAAGGGVKGAFLVWQGSGFVIDGVNIHDITTSDMENQGAIAMMASYMTVKNSTIKAYNAAGITAGMSGYDFTNGLIENNNIDLNGLGNGLYISQNTNDYVIRNNYITNTGHSFAQIRDCVRTKVHNNVFYKNNLVTGAQLGFQFRDWDNDSPPDQVDSNEFYNNVVDPGGGNCFTMTGQDNVSVRNNIFMNCTHIYEDTNWANGYSQGITLKYNIYYNYTAHHDGTWGGTYTETNNLVGVNPVISGTGARPYPYYSLQASSPAIDAGDPSFAVPPGWNTIDIGAYEWFPAGGNIPSAPPRLVVN